jgi:hypothetical protein
MDTKPPGIKIDVATHHPDLIWNVAERGLA